MTGEGSVLMGTHPSLFLDRLSPAGHPSHLKASWPSPGPYLPSVAAQGTRAGLAFTHRPRHAPGPQQGVRTQVC